VLWHSWYDFGWEQSLPNVRERPKMGWGVVFLQQERKEEAKTSAFAATVIHKSSESLPVALY